MSNGFVAALDVGARRIGVALASSIARLPAPYTTIDLGKVGNPRDEIKHIVDDNFVEVLVVGLPRDMGGYSTEQTQYALSFAKNLEEVLDIPIVMQDEAVTSVAAEDRLKNRGKPYQKADIDAEAACIILEDYFTQSGRNTG